MFFSFVIELAVKVRGGGVIKKISGELKIVFSIVINL